MAVISSSTSRLSTFTGLSEAELQQRAESFAAQPAQRARLSSLDAALLQAPPSTATQDAFAALSTTSLEAHGLEEPLHSFRAAGSQAGFAVTSTTGVPAAASTATLEQAARAAMARVGGFVDATAEVVDDVTLEETSDTDSDGTDSMNIELEQLKNEMNKLSQMQTAMSNVLTSLHTSAMTIINNIKA